MISKLLQYVHFFCETIFQQSQDFYIKLENQIKYENVKNVFSLSYVTNQ